MGILSRFVFIAFCVCLFFACKTNRGTDADLSSIEVTFDEKDGQIVEFMGLVDSISLVELHIGDGFLLGNISDVRFTDDRIYVLDRTPDSNQALYVYDRSGSPLFRVALHGRGPGEYIDIGTFMVSEEYIVLYDDSMGKVLVYDLNGVFQYQWENERNTWDIGMIDDRTLAEHDGAGTLTLTDLKGEACRTFSVDTKGITDIDGVSFTYQDANLNFIDPINQSVWRVTADSLVLHRRIDLGRWQTPSDYYKSFKGGAPNNMFMNVRQTTGSNTDYGLFTGYRESSTWEVYVFLVKMLPQVLYRNKATGKTFFVKFDSRGKENYDEGFKTLGIGGLMATFDELFVMSVSPAKLIQFRDDSRVADPMLVRLQEYVKGKDISEDGNNWLLLYRLKDSK